MIGPLRRTRTFRPGLSGDDPGHKQHKTSKVMTMDNVKLFVTAALMTCIAPACRKELCEMADAQPCNEPLITFYYGGSHRHSGPDSIAQTRGSSLRGSVDIERTFGSKGINIKAIHNSTDYFRTGEKLFCLSPGLWATCESYHWPSDAGDALNFWAWALDGEDDSTTGSGGASSASVSNVTADDVSLSFHYAMAQPGDDGMDALRQRELLVGCRPGATRENSRDGVGLALQHALSAVKINVGRANAGCLRSITFDNIFSDAECRVMAEGIEWTGHSGRTSFRQDFNTAIHGNLGDGGYQDISTSEQAEKDGTIFMTIPQDLDGASIRVDYQLAGKDTSEVFSTSLPGRWEAGRTYTYTLSILGGLSVGIDGRMDALTASALGFTNDGECPCYLRATLVGTWDDDAGQIVSPVRGQSNSVVRDPRWDEFWFFDPDSHIYYYRYPLRGGESVRVALLDEFNAVDGPEGCHLNMTVMVQAIRHDPDMSSVLAAIGPANGYIELLSSGFYEEE